MKKKVMNLSGRWNVMNHPILSSQSEVRIDIENCKIAITEKQQIIIVTMAWKPTRNEINFYFLPEIRCVIINKETLPFINCFNSIFLEYCEEDNTIECKLEIQSEYIQIKESEDIAIPTTSSGKDLSAFTPCNFGPYIVTTLPLVQIFEKLGLKMYINYLHKWGEELAILYDKKINKENFKPWRTPETHCLEGNERTSIISASINARFLCINDSDIDRGFRRHFKNKIANQSDRCKNNLIDVEDDKIVLLSRKIDKRLGELRWSNEEDFIAAYNNKKLSVINPQEMGVLKTAEKIREISPEIIISSVGSANWQLFLQEKYDFENLILFGHYRNEDLWGSIMVNYYNARDYVWIMYKNDGHTCAREEEEFTYEPYEILRAIEMIRGTKKLCSDKTFMISQNTYLMPPGMHNGRLYN